MSTGVCQRPPLQWPEGVLAAGVCFPYVLTLLPQALHVYSLVDQQLKETVCLLGAKGLLTTKGTAGCHYRKQPSRVDKHYREERFILIKIFCLLEGDVIMCIFWFKFIYLFTLCSSIHPLISLCVSVCVSMQSVHQMGCMCSRRERSPFCPWCLWRSRSRPWLAVRGCRRPWLCWVEFNTTYPRTRTR